MKTSNFIALSLTGLAVKTYMLIGIVWSKSNELYAAFQQAVPNGSTSTSVLGSSKA